MYRIAPLQLLAVSLHVHLTTGKRAGVTLPRGEELADALGKDDSQRRRSDAELLFSGLRNDATNAFCARRISQISLEVLHQATLEDSHLKTEFSGAVKPAS